MPHAQSVIPTWINEFNPTFYTKLTDQENWSYLNFPLELESWKTSFGTLVTAINSWKSASRESLLTDLLPQLFGYVIQNLMYSETPSVSFHADSLFTMSGFIASTLSRPESYYDLQTKIDNEVVLIGTFSTVEQDVAEAVMASVTGYSKSKIMSTLFSLEQPAVLSVGKESVLENIFVTNRYGYYYDLLNVGTLQAPIL